MRERLKEAIRPDRDARAATKPDRHRCRAGNNRPTKIQALSDLHLEHGGAVPPHVPGADVIVLAGDLAPHCEGLVERLRDHWAAAPHVLYVLGNHEFYGTEIDETSLGGSHFSTTASTETMRTRRGVVRCCSETPWTSARMRCTSSR